MPGRLLVLWVGIGLALAPCRPGNTSGVRFVDVTKEAGIGFVYISGSIGEKYMPEGMGSGAAFLDYDANGYLDLYILNGAPLPGYVGETPRNALYRNAGDGTFDEVTSEAGVGDMGYGMGTAVGDYDNDGDDDLYVTNVGANVLYQNLGDGTFDDVSTAAAVADSSWGTGTAFVDYDSDGDLDLYVANYLDFNVASHHPCWVGEARAYCAPTVYPGVSGVLYRNDGDGTFTDVTAKAGLRRTDGRQLGVVFGDYDDDGDQDLFVANDKTPNFLFRNDGDGTFTEWGLTAGVAYSMEGEPESAMGTDMGDYDNDGRLDIVLATYQWVPNTLYRNMGQYFVDVTYPAHLAANSLAYLGMTAAFLDYDNDGYLDIFLANGHLDPNVKDFDPAADYRQRNQMFRNDRKGSFTEVTDALGQAFKVSKVSHGACFGDYDNDGDTDIFVSDSDGQLSQLLRNEGGNAGHFLQVRLVGRRSNQDAIGARLRVVAGDLTQTRELHRTYGYLSSNDGRILLGLGEETAVDTLEIRWPAGQIQRLVDVAADQRMTIREELP